MPTMLVCGLVRATAINKAGIRLLQSLVDW